MLLVDCFGSVQNVAKVGYEETSGDGVGASDALSFYVYNVANRGRHTGIDSLRSSNGWYCACARCPLSFTSTPRMLTDITTTGKSSGQLFRQVEVALDGVITVE